MSKYEEIKEYCENYDLIDEVNCKIEAGDLRGKDLTDLLLVRIIKLEKEIEKLKETNK